ncbi:MAG: proline racemase family protein [Usitatibacteraceae bacterium]
MPHRSVNPLFADWQWNPPADWLSISTIDMHTGGEPLRVITSGLPMIEGNTVLEKRRYFREHYDHLRTGLMWEPRGHADMYGAVLTPSIDADFDAFFIHNEGYSTMCGHAILALTKLAIETGLVKKTGEYPQLSINVPAGRIEARAHMAGGKVVEASFRNVPSFVLLRDQKVSLPDLGDVHFDVAYGGAFYALVEVAPLGLRLDARDYDKLIDIGRRIKNAVAAQFPIHHPFESDLSFLYGTIFTGPAESGVHHSRNVCVFAEGEVDRSATGSGVSARAALHHARGELRVGERITIESILGSTMSVCVAETAKFGDFDAVVPEVSGTASFTGKHEFWFDPADVLGKGFIFR